MNNHNINDVIKEIDQFEQESQILIPRDAENKIFKILEPLMASDGYSLEYTGGAGDRGIDYVARKQASLESEILTTGIQYKHYGRKRRVGLDIVQQLLGEALLSNIDRIILLSISGFSREAWSVTTRDLPTTIELIDLDALRAWAYRLERSRTANHSVVLQAITNLSKQLARFIANNPKELDNLEWRDMERMLAEVFSRLGFQVELTPGSKDGGKDIILECVVAREKLSYIVEVKHWRSGHHVGKKLISDFINVVAREKRVGGLYLATYGYCDDAFEALTEIEREIVRFGSETKIVSLCQTFVKAESGLWSIPNSLPDLLFESTIKA